MPATATGRGAQVVLDPLSDTAKAVRGAYATTFEGNAAKVRADVLAGLVSDGTSQDGTTMTSGVATDVAVAPAASTTTTGALHCTTPSTSPTDLTHGVDLYGGVAGMTFSLGTVATNFLAGGSGIFHWYIGGADQGYLNPTGLNNMPVGQSAAAAGAFTTFNASGYCQLGWSGADVVVGTQAVAPTTATAGHLLIPFCAGPPTGVPTNATKGIALQYDTVTHKLWAYDNGTWRGIVVT